MKSQDIRIRRLHAGDSDLALITAQINAAEIDLSSQLTAESLGGFLADARNVYLVAMRGDQLAGTLHAIGYLHPGGRQYVYVDELDADARFRRRGVATRLMQEVMDIARRMGADEIWLGADEGNTAAHALYRSLDPSDVDPGVIYTYKL